ncbi:hypothetical protein HRbin19_01108 [bacterium HR19]|nr:hypothetical protein HRbin19_01108 [bacterium HR19]
MKIIPDTRKIIGLYHLHLPFFLIFAFSLNSCEKPKKVEIEPPISDDKIIEKRISIKEIKMSYPQNLTFFTAGTELQISLQLSCPDFPRKISISAEVSDEKNQNPLKVSPAEITCLGEQEYSLSISIPSEIEGLFYLKIALKSDFPQDITQFITKKVYIVKFEGSEHVMRNWKQIAQKTIPKLGKIQIYDEDEKIKFLATSGNNIISFDFYPQSNSFSEPSTIFSLSATQNSPSEKVEIIQSIKIGDKYLLIIKALSEFRLIEVSKDNNSQDYGKISSTLISDAYIESPERYIFFDSTCSKLIAISKSGKNINEIPLSSPCFFYYQPQGKREEIIYLSPTSDGTGIFAVSEKFSSENFTEKITDITFDQILTNDKGEIIFFKLGVDNFLNIQLKVMKLTADKNIERREVLLPLPKTAVNSLRYIPLSENKIFVYYEPTYKNSNTVVVSVINISDETGIEKTFAVQKLNNIFIKSSGNKKLIAFYERDKIAGFLFDGINLARNFTGYFSGDPIDFSSSQDEILIVSRGSGRLVFFVFSDKSSDYFFTNSKVLSYRYFIISPQIFFMIFTDDTRCWEGGTCYGSEFSFIKLQSITIEEKFFEHTRAISQRFVGFTLKYKFPLCIIQDIDKILIFMR